MTRLEESGARKNIQNKEKGERAWMTTVSTNNGRTQGMMVRNTYANIWKDKRRKKGNNLKV